MSTTIQCKTRSQGTSIAQRLKTSTINHNIRTLQLHFSLIFCHLSLHYKGLKYPRKYLKKTNKKYQIIVKVLIKVLVMYVICQEVEGCFYGTLSHQVSGESQRKWALSQSQDVSSCPLCSPCHGRPSPPTRSPPTEQCLPDSAPQPSPRAPPLDWIALDGEGSTECSVVRTGGCCYVTRDHII